MNKRGFLRALAGLPGAAWAMMPLLTRAAQPCAGAADTPTGPHRAPASSARRVLIQSSPLAGFQYHAGDEVWPQLAVEQPVSLVREPDNSHDTDAVRIDWRGHKLGYLPRAENTAVAQMIDRGERLSARISALRQAADPWQRVGIEVLLDA